jgi:hypothetical protein
MTSLNIVVLPRQRHIFSRSEEVRGVGTHKRCYSRDVWDLHNHLAHRLTAEGEIKRDLSDHVLRNGSVQRKLSL